MGSSCFEVGMVNGQSLDPVPPAKMIPFMPRLYRGFGRMQGL